MDNSEKDTVLCVFVNVQIKIKSKYVLLKVLKSSKGKAYS